MTEEFAALYVVPTPLGNLADLTHRAEEILRTVPWVAAEDTRHSGPLLKQLGSRARTLPAHQHNEHEAAVRIGG
jgi:16S rRNA (cytidine1402-2'-O)-methyltransferase